MYGVVWAAVRTWAAGGRATASHGSNARTRGRRPTNLSASGDPNASGGASIPKRGAGTVNLEISSSQKISKYARTVRPNFELTVRLQANVQGMGAMEVAPNGSQSTEVGESLRTEEIQQAPLFKQVPTDHQPKGAG
ncbi:hypothetical protein DFP72DRAFT_1057174 [Ephemerocybe angulata]|uniref:Uncharacterized protein n=1 Tax=Ephemerocybe angulata TaxID=980116 RepID=A0A8H6ME40_9AGAR|nr:hypothetical protein DFP72DRAFT_1057174 [Tulosesus angulatus]